MEGNSIEHPLGRSINSFIIVVYKNFFDRPLNTKFWLNWTNSHRKLLKTILPTWCWSPVTKKIHRMHSGLMPYKFLLCGERNITAFVNIFNRGHSFPHDPRWIRHYDNGCTCYIYRRGSESRRRVSRSIQDYFVFEIWDMKFQWLSALPIQIQRDETLRWL